jgi:hypothetical protein
MKSKPKPKTKAEWAAYRCQLNAQIACDALDGKAPKGIDPMHYAIYCLARAIVALSDQINEQSQQP